MLTERRAGFVLLVCFATSVASAAGRQEPTPGAAMAVAEQKAGLMAAGAEVYGRDCAECHEGGAGPVLNGNTSLSNTDRVVTAILLGLSQGDMPDFGRSLTDHQIAGVATYIRNSWDNAFGIVLDADVKRTRQELATKK